MKPSFSDPLNNYINIEDGKELKIIQDMHDMYLERPGCDKATLDQFIMHYDDSAKDDEDIETVSESELPMIVTSEESSDAPDRLPKTIVLTSGKRLSLRKSPKVLSFPTPEEDSDDYIRLMVTLFHPHRSYEEVQLNIEDMRKIFEEKDPSPRKNGKGMEMTKIETLMMLLHPYRNKAMWNKLFAVKE